MAKVTKLACDVCGTEAGVMATTVARGRKWQVDLCDRCYKKALAPLEKVSHPPTRGRKPFKVVTPLD